MQRQLQLRLLLPALLVAAALLAAPGCADGVARVANASELLAALRDPGVASIILTQDVTLAGPGWQGSGPVVVLSRDVKLSGPPPPPQQQPGDRLVVLDAAHQTGRIELRPSAMLTMEHLELRNSLVRWAAALPLLVYAPGSHVRLHRMVRRVPLCQPDLDAWVQQTLETLSAPAGYSPPPELYDAAADGPFRTRMGALLRAECEAAWPWPASCGAALSLLSKTVCHAVPASRRSDDMFASAVHEYFNVLHPCDGFVSQACVDQRGLTACFNAANQRLVWLLALRRHWGAAALLAASAAVAAAAAALVAARWRRQRSARTAAEAAAAAAASPPATPSATSSGTRAAAAAAGLAARSLPGDLRLGPLLGAGSFGRVYRGAYRGRTVAVKVLEVPLSRYSAARNELAINQLVSHANLVALLGHTLQNVEAEDLQLPSPGSDTGAASTAAARLPAARSGFGSTPSSGSGGSGGSGGSSGSEASRAWVQLLLILEHCDGGTLRNAVLAGRLRLPGGNMDAVLRVALDVARALAYLHSRNIIHGDLCTHNVLLASSDEVPALAAVAKVADFGLSALVPAARTHLSMTSVSTGTLTHAAPELFTAQQRRPACDVYALGVLLWELVSLGAAAGDGGGGGGKRPATITHPYQHLGSLSNPFAILPHVLEGGRPRWPTATLVPGPYKRLAERCWHADPAQRPSAVEVVAVLESALAQTVGDSGQQRGGDAHLGDFDVGRNNRR